jgi:hypothetical protein
MACANMVVYATHASSFVFQSGHRERAPVGLGGITTGKAAACEGNQRLTVRNLMQGLSTTSSAARGFFRAAWARYFRPVHAIDVRLRIGAPWR